MSPRRTPRREQQAHLRRLGDELRRARESVRPSMTGTALAAQLGWGQTKVSLIEGARQTPTEDDIRAWAAATGADTAALLDLRDRSLTRLVDVRLAARRPGGVEALQGDLELLESGSNTIAEYQITTIPGLAQTAAYTRAWLTKPGRIDPSGPISPAALDAALAGRASRQRQAADRHVVIAVHPTALTEIYGAVDVQVAQLDSLLERVKSPRFELIVTRGSVPLLHGFELLDDTVFLENAVGGVLLAHDDILGQFRQTLARIRRQGAIGAAAIREVERARGLIT